MSTNKMNNWLLGLGGLILALILISIGFGYWYGFTKLEALTGQISALETDLAETVSLLSLDLTTIQSGLSEEQETVASLQQQLGGFQRTVGNISGSVSTLEKLTQTDPQLLKKYSKVFFLNEHYEPPRLVEVPKEYKYNESRTVRFHAQAWPYLEDLILAAKRDGIDLYVASGFRSFTEQSNIKTQYTITYGAGTANQFSAEQGYSEHQLGTAVDFLTTGIGGTLPGFEKTEAYQWLLKNAHRFGFILSYPENNDYYIFEPWHWRFVGVKLATDLNRAGDYFYDWDQRKIDEYLVYLFD